MCEWTSGSCQGEVGANEIEVETCGSAVDYNCDGGVSDRPDGFEPNNTCGTCEVIGMPDPRNFTLTASLDSYADRWDYYCFDVIDDLFTLFPESITVTLNNVPDGEDYDLFLYKSIADCNNENELASSSRASGSDEELEWTEPRGEDDAGRYVIGVKSYTTRDYSCDEYYTLTVDGLH